ncbi:hypothetical protein J1N35_027525 [Gossypium stocksii]|uniref:RNase H type-1 domain-containing protein n=1 Tax=Gossypium stocksii TaxID=47602 RepID=A0A9D3ZZ76_9ROSI|nr:hypothetical protein J1N35_027525 [Gossypium stocksii]
MVKDNPIAGIAMVCRDSNGQIINGSNGQLCVGPIEVAEAMSFKDTCSIISHKNWPQVFIESDCNVVVDQIFASSEGISWILSAIIDSIKSFQAANPQVQCSFIGEKQTGWQTRWLFVLGEGRAV